MRLQKTTEHAIRVMTYLAVNKDQRFSVNVLHKELGIPYKYLGRLMSKLAQAGLVQVLQGKHGGYQLGRELEKIYLYEVVGVVEGLEDYDRCILGFPNCSNDNPCPMHHFWSKIQSELKEFLYNTTLADLEKFATHKI
ncbi:RrF2 family transcriptional regulator [Caldithrix abyssi]|uniref:Rrf2 family protein n=1 Tax=Caldithrix abyssi DSM 13497 TaxID=880073 RepID=H1XVL6_CALAY|nr:Rrf2 family transcriptional regulator [Caldithrix abyssi]APF18958.1 Rrf2 family protein [Caldithrix abyssi DSM 13497]EHO42916.1 transcriptional regulator, BadM/Rrf2 family [Caldithrix abyssi DSM 13497]